MCKIAEKIVIMAYLYSQKFCFLKKKLYLCMSINERIYEEVSYSIDSVHDVSLCRHGAVRGYDAYREVQGCYE